MKKICFSIFLFIPLFSALCDDDIEIDLSFFNRPLSSVVASKVDEIIKPVYMILEDALKHTEGVSFCVSIKNMSPDPIFICQEDDTDGYNSISFEVEIPETKELIQIKKTKGTLIANAALIRGRMLYPGYSMLVPVVFDNRHWNIEKFYGKDKIDHSVRIRAVFSSTIKTVKEGKLHVGPVHKNFSKWYDISRNIDGSMTLKGQDEIMFDITRLIFDGKPPHPAPHDDHIDTLQIK